MSSGWRFPSPYIWAQMDTLRPPPQQAKGKASCASSFQLLSLPFRARPGKGGRAKHLMQVSVHSFKHPWARGKTRHLPLLQGGCKGLRQQASIKGSSQAEGVEKLRWVAQTPWNLRNFPLLSHFPSSSLEGESTRTGPQAHPYGQARGRSTRDGQCPGTWSQAKLSARAGMCGCP